MHGARLLMLIRGGAEWEGMNAQLAILVAAVKGARPRDWAAGLIEFAAGPENGSADARSGRVFRYNGLADQGRPATTVN